MKLAEDLRRIFLKKKGLWWNLPSLGESETHKNRRKYVTLFVRDTNVKIMTTCVYIALYREDTKMLYKHKHISISHNQ